MLSRSWCFEFDFWHWDLEFAEILSSDSVILSFNIANFRYDLELWSSTAGILSFITEILSSGLQILCSATDTLRSVAEIMSAGAEIVSCASEIFGSAANNFESWCCYLMFCYYDLEL